MIKTKVARAKFSAERNIPNEGIPLQDPYLKNDDSIIKNADDFTISITTISERLYTSYQTYYRAGEYDNDYFVLLSSIGLGEQSKPTVKVHQIEPIANISGNTLDIFAENVVVVDDYEVQDEQGERVYLAFHGLCQSLGKTPLQRLKDSFTKVLDVAGSVFVGLAPFTSVGTVVAEGAGNILKKLSDNPDEVKTVEFNLYPVFQSDQAPHPGEAPLQTGAYVLFFEETDITGLSLSRAGVVISATGTEIPPYVVINIKKGKTLAPGMLDTSAAIEVLDKFHAGPGEFAARGSSAPEQYFEALAELGQSYRLAAKARRYFALKQKGEARTEAEDAKFNEIASLLRETFPNWDNTPA